MNQVKIFGERNTATNVLAEIIKQNSKSEVLPGTINQIDNILAKNVTAMRKAGVSNDICETEIDKIFLTQKIKFQWKHAATNFNSLDGIKNTFFIFIIRDPLSWILSLYKNPYNIISPRPNTFEEFYDMDWKLTKRDNLDINSCRPIELYQYKLESYVNFISKLAQKKIKYSIVKFEKLIQSQENIFNLIKGNLENPNKSFIEFKKSTKDVNKNMDYYKQYYSNELWKKEIPPYIFDKFEFDGNLISYFDLK